MNRAFHPLVSWKLVYIHDEVRGTDVHHASAGSSVSARVDRDSEIKLNAAFDMFWVGDKCVKMLHCTTQSILCPRAQLPHPSRESQHVRVDSPVRHSGRLHSNSFGTSAGIVTYHIIQIRPSVRHEPTFQGMREAFSCSSTSIHLPVVWCRDPRTSWNRSPLASC